MTEASDTTGGARTEPPGATDAGTDATGADGGYVHRPDEWGGRSDRDEEAAREPGESTSARSNEGPGRDGWTLVGVVVLAFLVVPGVIYLRPATPGEMGFGFLTAMLVLPMVPAALLGATAVWTAVRGRRD